MDVFSRYLPYTSDEMLSHQTLLINAIDEQHKIIFWNIQCEKHFGISKEQALGKRLEEIFPEVNDTEQMDRIKRAFAGREVMLFRQPYKRRYGFFDQQLIPLKDEDGKVVALLNVVKEVR